MSTRKVLAALAAVSIAIATIALSGIGTGSAAAKDGGRFANRGDIRHLPGPLKEQLVTLAGIPSTYVPQTAFNEATDPSHLFQYYLLDANHFQANTFSTANAQGTTPVLGAVRVVLEPKPGLPTDPTNVRAAIDTFTDISGLPVINNESGWYEAWMIHDLLVPHVAAPRADGKAQFGMITSADAKALAKMGSGNDVPEHLFTIDGNMPGFGSRNDMFPVRRPVPDSR